MCGIAAILAFKNKSLLNKSRLENMTEEISHRGPDDEGFLLNNWAGFGFKRLSIMDTSYEGHQPMFDVTNNYVIVFNGEIYNYKILKEALIKKNYRFRSDTDTEVLLNAYIEWGTSCFNKLEGMFALLIYDKIKDEIIAARDHLGIKPLYYYKHHDFYLFGSEIKAFKSILKFQLNEEQLYEQFVYGYVSDHNTIFKNIYRVKPGTYLKFNKKGFLGENRFYNITDTFSNETINDPDLKEIKHKIDRSIFNHTMSDVGYNIQLSGGIDSSYITAVLTKEYGQTLHTFSVKLENTASDESRFQEIVAGKYNTIHHSFLMTGQDICANYEKATWHYDIPMMHPSSILLMLLCEHSRNHSKVILTGEGSDELFGGYRSFKNYNIIKYRILNFLKRHNIIVGLIPDISALRTLKNSIRNIHLGIDQSAFFSREKSQLVFNDLNEKIEFRKSAVENVDHLVNKIFASFQTSYLNYLFERQDKMSMAMSVEARVPFSNHLLFNELNKISFKKKIKPVPKAILKKLSEEYYGKSFIYRKKIGFDLPLDDWLRDKNQLQPMLALLTDKTFKERGFYNHKKINSLINNHLAGKENNSNFLINMIDFEVWHRLFIDKYN